MSEQKYRLWLTNGLSVKVGREKMQELCAEGRVVTIKEIGQKQPIRNQPAPSEWEIQPAKSSCGE
ncbi:hypothetical protein AYO40_01250 [Planctomycetaceae bacterium SCGC AG-212-D15]|nr:hypothetical protein AYO40_01250 [Planctomycetaceae bacterium SCGC AG-212-D15]